MNNRGQTPQDFVVGASVLLLTIIATFAFVQGTVFQAYAEPTGADLESGADRAASYVVENYSVDGERNVLRFNQSGGINDTLSGDLTDFKRNTGLDVATDRRRTPSVNLTIVDSPALANGSREPAVDRDSAGDPRKLTWGQPYRGQRNPATTSRVVSLTDPGNKCETVCWLFVRVW